ncbi:MAG: D-alanine--poly(phosphoribitol) ligase subunit DltC [Clostridiales bacterium]|nr:D-alanine--poly(phosphoribitol) ligase subunit DltC [Clostridiales bacterium]
MREKILDIIEELCGDEIVKEDQDIDLIEEGLIDSLDYITLLIEIEKEFGLKMSPSEFTREEMSTPAKIVDVIGRRLEESK